MLESFRYVPGLGLIDWVNICPEFILGRFGGQMLTGI
jgi:hypothetical protein